jgi:hypothetical protein
LNVELIVVVVALLVAVAALQRARRLGRRLDQVVESYWELRYEYGQLRAQVDRQQGKPLEEPAAPAAFIPLSRLRSPDSEGEKAASK